MRAALRAMVNDDPLAALTRERDELLRINAVLMDRVERSTDLQGNAFSIFETAIALEGKVRLRTTDLETALAELAKTNAALAGAKEAADDAQQRLRDAIASINEGFAIFDAEDRLVLCNQTCLGLWPNVADQIIPGMRFDEIARLVGDNRTTLGAIVAPEQWISERMAQHRIAEGGHVHALAAFGTLSIEGSVAENPSFSLLVDAKAGDALTFTALDTNGRDYRGVVTVRDEATALAAR